MSKPVLEDLFAFHGRRNRKSYALLHLTVYGLGLALCFVILLLDELLGGTGVLAAVLLVGLIISMTAVSLIASAQRCRDVGLPGFAGLTVLLPYVGTLAWLALLFWPGEEGQNRFGDDPREIGR